MLFQLMCGPILPLSFSTFFEQLRQLNPLRTIIASSPSGSVKNKYNCVILIEYLVDFILEEGESLLEPLLVCLSVQVVLNFLQPQLDVL